MSLLSVHVYLSRKKCNLCKEKRKKTCNNFYIKKLKRGPHGWMMFGRERCSINNLDAALLQVWRKDQKGHNKCRDVIDLLDNVPVFHPFKAGLGIMR